MPIPLNLIQFCGLFLGPQLVWGFLTFQYLCHALLSVAWRAGVYISVAPRSGLLSVLFRCATFMLLDHAQSHFRASEFY